MWARSHTNGDISGECWASGRPRRGRRPSSGCGRGFARAPRRSMVRRWPTGSREAVRHMEFVGVGHWRLARRPQRAVATPGVEAVVGGTATARSASDRRRPRPGRSSTPRRPCVPRPRGRCRSSAERIRPAPGWPRPSWAASTQRSAVSPTARLDGVGGWSSSSSTLVTATATCQNGVGRASNMRSSSQPFGRTGGNSVVRW